MSPATRIGLLVLLSALMLGILGDVLLGDGATGLGASLFGTAAIAFALALCSFRPGLNGQGVCLSIAALVFSALLSWRDSSWLKILDIGAFGLLYSLLIFHMRDAKVFRMGVTDYAFCTLEATAASLGGFPTLLNRDIRWKELTQSTGRQQTAAALRGLLIAAPILVVFGLLFASADVVFAQMISGFEDIDTSVVGSHLAVVGSIAWVTAGLLRIVVMCEARSDTQLKQPEGLSLGTVEIGAILGSVNLLFAFFVFIQFRFFFGGTAVIHTVRGLTYSDYARRGFFELAAVAVLALVLLLSLHWLIRSADRGCEMLFRVLSAVLLVMVGIVLASALERMQLYCAAYGITELRFYTTAFMLWLPLVIGWFAATVLCGARELFAAGALISGLIGIVSLHVVNPDAYITKANLSNLQHGHRFDTQYALSLSADSVPTLVASLPSFSPAERLEIENNLVRLWSGPLQTNWRTYNLDRAAAQSALEGMRL